MKTLFLISFLLSAYALQAQNADVILGKWYNEEKDAIINIYKENGKYTGKIVWLKEPYENGKPKVDDKNPDPKLATRPVMGLKLFWGFRYDPGEKQWTDGRIYDPKSGKTYDCYMWMEGKDLKIKGYVLGMKFLGRKTTWTRAE